MIWVQCPGCKKVHQVPEAIDGKKVSCKDCGRQFVAQKASDRIVDALGKSPVARPLGDEPTAQPIDHDTPPMLPEADDVAQIPNKIDVICPACGSSQSEFKDVIGHQIICRHCGDAFIGKISIDDISPEMLAAIPTGLAAAAEREYTELDVASSREEQKFSGYNASRILGTGTASTVWLATDQNGGRTVALKRVIKKSGPEKIAIDQAQHEFTIGSTFEQQNIRRIFEIHQEKAIMALKEIHLVMEYCSGQSLMQYTSSTIPTVLRIFEQIGRALEYIHEKQMLHSEITPDNIIVSSDGNAKLIDLGKVCPFGTVRKEDKDRNEFIAPEQLAGVRTDNRTDIYSFGAVLYWVLTGVHVPMAESKRFGAMIFEDAKFPGDLKTIVNQCVEIQPAKRWDSISKIVAKIEAIRKEIPEVRL